MEEITTATTQETTPKAEDIAASILKAVEARNERNERSIAKSFAEQYGMTEAEVADILAKAKSEKETRIPDTMQAEIDKRMQAVNDKLIAAEVASIGTKLGLVDASAALLMMDKASIKVDDAGGVTGVSEALEALQKAKPYLFTASPTGKKVDIGGKVAVSTAPEMSGVEAAFYKRNPKLKK